jgi:transposase
MEHIGIDVHKRTSHLCMMGDDGVLTERRVETTRESFARHLGDRPKARIVIEASTESEWVACCLEDLGHEVVVADPNFAPMYATRTRKVKTDRRDARALCEACRLGAYRPAHRPPPERRHQRAELRVRAALVRTRSRYISLIGAIVRRDGYRIPPGSASHFRDRITAIDLSEHLRTEIEPLLDVMELLDVQIADADKRLAQYVASDPVAKRLTTVPGVGPVTAAAFTAVLDTCERFQSARQVRAYAGLVPREMSSGERQQRGRITKAGNGQLRSLLVEVAWCVMRTRRVEAQSLREWALRIAARRGKRIASVALARKLAGVLYAMWRDGTEFGQPQSPAQPPATTLAA